VDAVAADAGYVQVSQNLFFIEYMYGVEISSTADLFVVCCASGCLSMSPTLPWLLSQGVNYMSRVFRGAEHNEAAWRARLREPLRFMFGRRSTFGGASPRFPGLGVVRAYERSPRAAAFSPSGVWRS
jgi:hypothetical protein